MFKQEGRQGRRPTNKVMLQNRQQNYSTNGRVDQSLLPSWDSIFLRLGLPLPKRGRAQCCLHGGNSHQSLSLSDKGFFKCFVCGASGDKIGFIRKLYGCDFKRALAWFGLTPGKLPKPDPADWIEVFRSANVKTDRRAA